MYETYVIPVGVIADMNAAASARFGFVCWNEKWDCRIQSSDMANLYTRRYCNTHTQNSGTGILRE